METLPITRPRSSDGPALQLTSRDRLSLGALIVALAFVVIGRALLYGSTISHLLGFWAVVAGYVILPGWMIWRCLRRGAEPVELGLGMSALLGLAALTIDVIVLSYLHRTSAIIFHPMLFAVLAPWGRARADVASSRDRPSTSARLGLLAVLMVAALRVPLGPLSGWWVNFDADVLFHAGNAAALASGFPLLDPRIAGEPLNYHVFGYALHVAAHEVAGIPFEESLARSSAAFFPLLLCLQVFNAGRALSGRALGGFVAAGLLILAGDVSGMLRAVGSNARPPAFFVDLRLSIYGSFSCALGLASLASIVIAWLDLERSGPGPRSRFIVLLAVFSFLASGTKPSVTPAILLGIGGALLARPFLGQRITGSWWLALFASLAAVLPATWLLASGDNSYAKETFRWSPWSAMRAMEWFAWLRATLGLDSAGGGELLSWVLAPAWLALFLGGPGIAVGIFMGQRGRRAEATTLGLAAIVLVTFGLGNLLVAADGSQTYFLGDAELALALLAARAFTSDEMGRKTRIVLLGLPMVTTVIPGFVEAAAAPRRDFVQQPTPSPELVQLREALLWVRDHSPPRSVVVVPHRGMLASPLCERAGLIETKRFAPRIKAVGWWWFDGRWFWILNPGHSYSDRVGLVKRLFTSPQSEDLDQLRSLLPVDTPIYLIHERVRIKKGPDVGFFYVASPLDGLEPPWPHDWTQCVFANPAAAVHVLLASAGRKAQ